MTGPDEVYCVECDAPATRFTEPKAEYDPHCEMCYEGLFEACDCGRVVHKADLVEVCTFSGDRMSPAEYEARCDKCCADGPDEPDYDAMNDDDNIITNW